MLSITLAAVLVVLLAMALWGDLGLKRECNDVSARLVPGAKPQKMFVLLHGFRPQSRRWTEMAEVLKPHGDVLVLRYEAGPTSNADASAIAANVADAVQKHGGGKEIVFVAHSMGALLARRAVVDGLKAQADWAGRVTRMVLLAGMNRGWSVDGTRAADASMTVEFELRAAAWLGRMLGMGGLMLEMERGTPFVSNLRLDWMQQLRDSSVEVVQLLGDIDDLVRREDNEDLRATAIGQFALLRVRGTNHRDITDIGSAVHTNELQAYRRAKLLLAAVGDFSDVCKHNEELPLPVNGGITKIVFVLHGIRDLGRWSSAFETEVKQQQPGDVATLRFESPRYGYLGMGPFLFASVRDRYVRWFMDEYTEAVARHPMVKPEDIRFFGHSNGTYLLAAALEKYTSMRVGRVVLAGSVVRTGYGWKELQDSGRVGAVRNYVGTHDWVVALFPRLFELPVFRWLDNPLGGGGFHGFDQCQRVENRLVAGAHGAFDGHEREIVQFLMGTPAAAAAVSCVDRAQLNEQRSLPHKLLGLAPVVLLGWASLVALVGYLGVRVVGAAGSPAWPVLVVYVLLVITLLRTA